MTTVFMLDGFGWDGFLPLTKVVQSLGPNRVQVSYNNDTPNLTAITDAVHKLDGFLHDPQYDAKKTVAGVSMGCQVAYKWIRDVGPTSDVADVSFVLLANPENKFTGCSVYAPTIWGGGYGGRGIPDDTRFPVNNVIRQYDGVADYPNVPNPSWLALAHAVWGMARVHNNYFSVTLDDPRNRSHQEGNVTYTWSPTTVSWLFGGAAAKSVIEKSYQRPVAL